ncbi:hypothetical protein SARC_02204, partial [Sphaeroforma arctica JP610]
DQVQDQAHDQVHVEGGLEEAEDGPEELGGLGLVGDSGGKSEDNQKVEMTTGIDDGQVQQKTSVTDPAVGAMLGEGTGTEHAGDAPRDPENGTSAGGGVVSGEQGEVPGTTTGTARIQGYRREEARLRAMRNVREQDAALNRKHTQRAARALQQALDNLRAIEAEEKAEEKAKREEEVQVQAREQPGVEDTEGHRESTEQSVEQVEQAAEIPEQRNAGGMGRYSSLERLARKDQLERQARKTALENILALEKRKQASMGNGDDVRHIAQLFLQELERADLENTAQWLAEKRLWAQRDADVSTWRSADGVDQGIMEDAALQMAREYWQKVKSGTIDSERRQADTSD